ncbi:hypothetical protein F5141DRAFT_1146679 [Pisolithus sp. B1]|nr:hypothetical protein F5141DRAFT_1146679 [Pisolithus sp. B1]
MSFSSVTEGSAVMSSMTRKQAGAGLVSDRIYAITHSKETVTTAYASSPGSSPGRIMKKLYRDHQRHKLKKRGGHWSVGVHRDVPTEGEHPKSEKHHKPRITGGVPTDPLLLSVEPTQVDLDRAVECGDFGKRPSDLFLRMYVDILALIDRELWSGVVSPPLLGSKGVVTMSIISVIPDIIQHHCDCIVAARYEIFLATNFWQASKSSQKICQALKELSRRAERRGKRVVVKAMYDRAHLKMFTHNRVFVEEEEWLKEVVMLPKRSEIPWIDFELVNYHRPLLGTFHAKFMIVDRKIALVASNNIQDRPNMEMMVHLEGPIVDSLYDTALLCWSKPMHPPLPLLNDPYQPPEGGYKFGMDNEYSTLHNLDGTKGAELYHSFAHQDQPINDTPPKADKVFISGRYQTITEHLNAGDQPNTHATVQQKPTPTDEYAPHVLHVAHDECPMVLVNRGPRGSPTNPRRALRNAQDIAWLAGLKYANKKVFIQSPTLNARPVVEGVLKAVRRGVECTLYIDVGFNDGGEALPGQGGTNEQVAKRMYGELDEHEKPRLRMFWYTGKDQTKPINASAKKRNCHIKLMVIDDEVGIVGNGNQDTQSWYHSQEVNVMIDNPRVCEEWLGAIRRNQNTHLHELGKDGIYRDANGNVLTDSVHIESGFLGVIKGIRSSVARVRGRSGP